MICMTHWNVKIFDTKLYPVISRIEDCNMSETQLELLISFHHVGWKGILEYLSTIILEKCNASTMPKLFYLLEIIVATRCYGSKHSLYKVLFIPVHNCLSRLIGSLMNCFKPSLPNYGTVHASIMYACSMGAIAINS